MTWFLSIPSILASLGVLFAPGLALGFALGLRRLWLWALAPVLSTTMLVIASLALPMLHIAWTPINALAFAIIFAALVFALYRFVLRASFKEATTTSVSRWVTPCAWLFSAAVLTWLFVTAIGSAENISQTFDNVFHLNAIAYIGSTQNASSLAIGGLTAPGTEGGFYPLAWHALVELSQQITGSSAAVAVNTFNLAVATTAWPLGMILLTRQFAGKTNMATISTGILAASLPAFPMNMLFYGVLYPYFFGLTFVPVVVAILLQLLGLSKEQPISKRPALSMLLLGTLPAITLAHPTAMMTALAMSVPIALVATFRGWKSVSDRRRLVRLAALGIYGAVGLVMLITLRPGVHWGTRMSMLQAVWNSLALALEGYGAPIIIAALVLLAVGISLYRKDAAGIAAVGIWIIFMFLYFVAAAVESPKLRGLTGVWYADAPRLAAILVIATVPLAVISISALRNHFKDPHLQRWTTAIVLIALLGTLAFASGYRTFIPKMASSYLTTDSSVLLSSNERELLDRLDQIVPEGEMIIGSPWTGTSLAYAFANREVLMPHILMTLDGERQVIMERLKYADEDPQVCASLEALDAWWFLDFGDQEVHGANHVFAGLDGIEDTDAVELIESVGNVRLYRVTACS